MSSCVTCSKETDKPKFCSFLCYNLHRKANTIPHSGICDRCQLFGEKNRSLTSTILGESRICPTCYSKARREIPEVKERIAQYNVSEKRRADHRAFNKTEKAKTTRRIWEKEHNKLPEVKAKKSKWFKNWYEKHKNTPEYKQHKNKYFVERQKKDINFRLACNLRKRLNSAVSGKIKPGHLLDTLGCSLAELKNHLESKFTSEMSWDNYGKVWHIDHIFPLSKVDLSNPEEYKKVVHFSNLQPLLARDNIVKSNKI